MFLPHFKKTIQPSGKHTIGFFALLLLGLSGWAQVRFEPGYTVSYAGDTLRCWIKNAAWLNNPESIIIRRTENGPESEVSLKEIKAFGIGEEVLFRVEYVKVDVSPSAIEFLSMDREPVWKQDTLFLRLLVGGTANLYVYSGKGFVRYFYQMGSGPLSQLIFKKYRTFNSPVMENREFALQLGNDLRCGDASLVDIEKITYQEKALTRVFQAFNSCIGGESRILPTDNDQREKFRIQVLTGVDMQRYRVVNYEISGAPTSALYYEPKVKIGLEADVFLPFNKNKWSVATELGLNHFHNKRPIPVPLPSRFSGDIFIRYQSVEGVMGLRHHIYLPRNTQAIISVSGLIDWDFNSSLSIGILSQDAFRNLVGFAGMAGIGVRNGRWGLEARIYSHRLILERLPSRWDHRLSKGSLVLGYRLW